MIREEKGQRISRIFKWGNGFKRLDNTLSLLANSAKNVLALCSRKTIHVTSEDKDLRDLFLQIADRFNTEDEFNCEFDYDSYDYTVDLRKYSMGDSRFSVVIILYGKDMPNYWRMA